MEYKIGDKVKLVPEAWGIVLRLPEENKIFEVLDVKRRNTGFELKLSIDGEYWCSSWVTSAPKISLLSVKRIR